MRLIDAEHYRQYLISEMPTNPHEITSIEESIHYDTIGFLVLKLDEETTVDAVPVDWIEERIRNAKCSGHSLIAQMWQELIDGYRREKQKNENE